MFILMESIVEKHYFKSFVIQCFNDIEWREKYFTYQKWKTFTFADTSDSQK